MAVCAIIRDEILYIHEWIAFHILQGVSKFLLYDDGSVDGTKEAIGSMSQNADISLIDWSGRADTLDYAQRSAYMDGAAKLVGSADFVAFIDADEFLHCQNGRKLTDELASLPDDVSAVAVGLRLFGSAGHKVYSSDYVTSRFVKCTELDHPGNQWFKTVARPEKIKDFETVHNVVLESGVYVLNDYQEFSRALDHPGRASRIGQGTLQINHYMLKSLEEFRRKQARGHERGMVDRYDETYFFHRDTNQWANAMICDDLKYLAPKLSEIISRL